MILSILVLNDMIDLLTSYAVYLHKLHTRRSQKHKKTNKTSKKHHNPETNSSHLRIEDLGDEFPIGNSSLGMVDSLLFCF